jgi:uncharacterized protein YjiS (DUF1127 family)
MKAQTMAVSPRVTDMRPGSLARTRGPRQPTLWQRIAAWTRVADERRRLRELDPRLLRDIGLTPAEADREAYRPFWDVGPLR